MATFKDLGEVERIQLVKDSFVSIIEEIVIDPTKIKNYIDVKEPKLKVFVSRLTKTASEDEITRLKKIEAAEKEKLDKDNEQLLSEFAVKKAQIERINLEISKLKKKTGCSCGTCFDVDFINNSISTDLEVFIDYARKEVEKKLY